jgi:hypothetical protein
MEESDLDYNIESEPHQPVLADKKMSRSFKVSSPKKSMEGLN